MTRRRAFLKRISTAAGLGFLYNSIQPRASLERHPVRTQSNGSETESVSSGRISNGHRLIRDSYYEMGYKWHTQDGRQWSTTCTIDKEAYKPGTEAFRGYKRSFDIARSNPIASTLGNRLRPPSLSQEKAVDLAVRFVQSFDYARDIDSKGVHEYNRSIEEHLVEGIGDCKDGTYLLAGILSQPPFRLRTAVVIMPTHMLLGVHSTDLSNKYLDTDLLPDGEYVPIETTATRPIGYRPDDPVLLVYDGTLKYGDPSSLDAAVAGQIEEFSQYYLS